MKKKKKISKFEDEPEEETTEVPDDNMKNGEFVIPITGEIGWEVTADSVNKQLEKAEGQDVVFEIASPGGSVFEGVEIFNSIRNYEGNTEARIIGMAASMASYIPLATDKVLAEDNATFMIHNAWGIAIGDSEEMKAEAEILESINGLLAQEYISKTGKSEKEVLQMMSDESWFFGSEIKDAGFVDEMIVHKDDKNKKDKKDKDSTLAEAKEKFKNTLSKVRENRMKSDLEKMKNRLNKNAMRGKMKMSKFVKWSKEYKKSLPDSAFADKKGRKLPYKDKENKVDVPHLRNSLIRVTQGKIKLNPESREKALRILKGEAKRYITVCKETKSGEIMGQAISKFEADVEDRLAAIVRLLKEKSTNKKPEDEISFEVKALSLLIQDLEEIVELEKARKEANKEETTEEETITKPTEKETENKDEEEETTEDKKEIKKPKKPDEEEETETEEKTETDEDKKTEEGKEDEEESKFQEAMKLCESYKGELEKNQKVMSKFQKEIDSLKGQNSDLTKQISKFQVESYNKLLDSTVEKISKFKKLNDVEKLNLKGHYLESKMSVSALEEVGRVTDEKMFSKLGEPKVMTKPSEMLEPANEEKDFSKMSKEDKLDELAKIQAKARGFVE